MNTGAVRCTTYGEIMTAAPAGTLHPPQFCSPLAVRRISQLGGHRRSDSAIVQRRMSGTAVPSGFTAAAHSSETSGSRASATKAQVTAAAGTR